LAQSNWSEYLNKDEAKNFLNLAVVEEILKPSQQDGNDNGDSVIKYSH
jgi:hypothetical protein